MLPEPKEEAGTYGSSLSNNPLQRREDRLAGALQAPANKAGDHRGQASPCGRAGAITARSEPASSSPAVPPTCPKQRSVAVADGQQRSIALAPNLRHCRMARSLTVLPKLAVRVRFPSPASPGAQVTSLLPASRSPVPSTCPRPFTKVSGTAEEGALS
jgi:hypothetical protein